MNDDDPLPAFDWPWDYERSQNPTDYETRANTSWLYDRYPTVISKPLGVKSRRFVDWVFPSFFNHVRNTYDYIDTPLSKGQTLTLRINANFPVESIGAEKRIIISTRNGLGGRHNMLAYVLLASAFACLLMVCSIAAIQACCPRRTGRARFAMLAPSVTQMLDLDEAPEVL